MGLTEDPLMVGQVLLICGDCLGGPARPLVGVGEVVARGQRVGVVGAQQSFLVG